MSQERDTDLEQDRILWEPGDVELEPEPPEIPDMKAMAMNHKTFDIIETKAEGDSGEFTAIVSVFGNVDSVGDRILPGAYRKTLAKRMETGDPLPIVLAHQWNDVMSHVGYALPEHIQEVGKGLLVRGKLDVEDNPVARQVHKLMQRRTLKEFSIGYQVPKGGEKRAKDGANDLTEIDLFECGPCLKGVNAETELLGVKSALEAKEVVDEPPEDQRERADRLAREEAERGAPKPIAAKAPAEAPDADAEELRELRAYKAAAEAKAAEAPDPEAQRAKAERVERDANDERLPEVPAEELAELQELREYRAAQEAKAAREARAPEAPDPAAQRAKASRLERAANDERLPEVPPAPVVVPVLPAEEIAELRDVLREYKAAQEKRAPEPEALKRAARQIEREAEVERLPDVPKAKAEPEVPPAPGVNSEHVAALLDALAANDVSGLVKALADRTDLPVEIKDRCASIAQRMIDESTNMAGRPEGRPVDSLRREADTIALEFASAGESRRKIRKQSPPPPRREPSLSLDDLRKQMREETLNALTGGIT